MPDEKSPGECPPPMGLSAMQASQPGSPSSPSSGASAHEQAEAIKQLRLLQEAAVLAAQGKVRCRECNRVVKLVDAVVIVARRNILLGVCMGCAPATRIDMRPLPNGMGYRVGTESLGGSGSTIIRPDISDVRAVETSKLSLQTAEKTGLGSDEGGD